MRRFTREEWSQQPNGGLQVRSQCLSSAASGVRALHSVSAGNPAPLSAFHLSCVTRAQLCRQLCGRIIFYNPISSRPPRQQGDWSGSRPTARLPPRLGCLGSGKKGRQEGGDPILWQGESEDAPELGPTKNERGRKGQNHPHTSPIWHHSCDSLSSTWGQTRKGLTFLSLLERK